MFILHLVFFLCSFLLYLMQVLVVYCFVAPSVPTFFLFLFFLCVKGQNFEHIYVLTKKKNNMLCHEASSSLSPLSRTETHAASKNKLTSIFVFSKGRVTYFWAPEL